jgi:hypothetical protein
MIIGREKIRLPAGLKVKRPAGARTLLMVIPVPIRKEIRHQGNKKTENINN